MNRTDFLLFLVLCATGVALTACSDVEDMHMPAPPAPTGFELRVNAGGDAYVDSENHSWVADTGFSGGESASTSEPVAGTRDQSIYMTERWTADREQGLTYSFTVPNGWYLVKLDFAEIWPGAFRAGDRVFDASVQGEPFLANFDIVDSAGYLVATNRSTYALVSDGTLTIHFAHGLSQNPKISGIELLQIPASDPRSQDFAYVPVATVGNVSIFAQRAWLRAHPLRDVTAASVNDTNGTGPQAGDASASASAWLLAHAAYGATINDGASLLDWSSFTVENTTATHFTLPQGFVGDSIFYTRAEGRSEVTVTKRDTNRVIGKDRLTIALSSIDDVVLSNRTIGDDNNENDYGGFVEQHDKVTFPAPELRLYKIHFTSSGDDDFTYDLESVANSFFIANGMTVTRPTTIYFDCVIGCTVTVRPLAGASAIVVDNSTRTAPAGADTTLLLEPGRHVLSTGEGTVRVAGFGLAAFTDRSGSTTTRFVHSTSPTAAYAVKLAAG